MFTGFTKLVAGAIAGALLCGCAGACAQGADAGAYADLQETLKGMTLRQKVGQLFFIRPDSLDDTLSAREIKSSSVPGVTGLTSAMADALKQYPVGGFAMFGKNLVSPGQITEFNRALSAACDIAPFIAVDEEGGLVARIANHNGFDVPGFASAAAVGASGQTDVALNMGKTIGGYLKEYGFNMDFAPVADVFTNPANTVIGTRAFSSDAETVYNMASACAQGLRDMGIIPVFKHFPGHGDTAEDSHYGIAVSNKSKAELEACEWLPFKAAGSRDAIMSAHVAVPAITGGRAPSTMSSVMINGVLKGELDFKGIVITDALEMGAVTDMYSPAEAALGALNAGCDMLLLPEDLSEAFEGVLAAVESGELSIERLDGMVMRILRFKRDNGLI